MELSRNVYLYGSKPQCKIVGAGGGGDFLQVDPESTLAASLVLAWVDPGLSSEFEYS